MQDKGLRRTISTLDKFYTKKEIVEECVEQFNTYVKVNKDDYILEPSAGSGAFSNFLMNNYNNVIAIDIKPEDKSIEEQDFLEFKYDRTEKIHVIGNPPFGRQSSLAKKFIKKASMFADSISFILPKSFKKDSFMKTFPLYYHLEFSTDLSTNSFLVNDKDHDVPCVFQIWVKKDFQRNVKVITKPDCYSYVKKDENPDVSIRRVGVNSGHISEDIESKSFQSHYFLKLSSIDKKSFIEKYNKHFNFSFNNTVGPKSISKSELDEYISSIIDQN
jgi:predicted RNA methylase